MKCSTASPSASPRPLPDKILDSPLIPASIARFWRSKIILSIIFLYDSFLFGCIIQFYPSCFSWLNFETSVGIPVAFNTNNLFTNKSSVVWPFVVPGSYPSIKFTNNAKLWLFVNLLMRLKATGILDLSRSLKILLLESVHETISSSRSLWEIGV